MADSVDQIFVYAKQWILSPLAHSPDWLVQIVSSLINIAALLAVFLTLFAAMSVLERKILGRIQNRYGPNRVGPFGLFQPVADGIKMLIKEDVVPVRADKIVHFFAPILMAATAILALGVIPYGRNMTPFAIDGGILFFFAVGSTTELAVFMAGWGSNNKFSMLGAMRAIAQMFSYELPLIITVLPVVMIVGSLTPDQIVAAQTNYWFVLTPWGATAFMPPNLHDWNQFITPAELLRGLEKAGLHNIEMVGLKPAANPVQLVRLLRRVKKGRMTPAEMGRRSAMAVSRDMTVLYIGYAVKPPSGW